MRDFSSEFVTGHATAGAGVVDQIYIMVPNVRDAIPAILPSNDCNSNNSDAAPVDDDYILFSNSSTGSYKGYLAAIASARVWDLSTIGLGAGVTNVLDMSYTRFGLTP